MMLQISRPVEPTKPGCDGRLTDKQAIVLATELRGVRLKTHRVPQWLSIYGRVSNILGCARETNSAK